MQRRLFTGLSLVLLGTLLCALALATDSQAALRYLTDDLEAHLVFDIAIPEDADAFVAPSANEQAIFYAAIQGLLRNEISATTNAVDSLGYDLIDFTDTVTGKTFYVLEERDFARGLGTYVFNPDPRRLLNIQTPHPHVDGNTWPESVAIFLQTEALFFQIAGTHRCAHPTPTTCSGTTGLCGGIYRISDVAHYTENFFQAASNAVHDEIEYLVSISIHQYGCDTDPQYEASSLAQISNGTNINVSGSIATRMALAYNAILFSPAIGYPFTGAGSFNRYSTEPIELEPVACNIMSGSTNVQGRYINGETSDPCGTGITSPVLRERFLHIEQQPPLVNETPDANGISRQITIDAISNLFEPTMWVDFAHTGIQTGSWAQPYASLATAVSNAGVGDTIMLKSGQGVESILLNDPPLLLRSAGGSALIRGATPIAVR